MPVILGGNTGIYLASLAPSVDPDAQAFITAAGITDPTQQSAINTLVVDLKGYNIWTKMKALYPFVGGTATSHSYNLRNTAQFQISWSISGVTHNSQGVTGDGVNGFGNTGLIPSTSLTNNSLNVTVYSRTNNVANATEIGCSTSSFLPIIGLGCRGLSDQIVFDGYDFTAHRLIPTNLDSRGFFHGNILTSTNQKVYKNGVQQASTTTAQTQTQPTVRPIYILARNDSGTAANYSNRNLAFSSIGDGLTDTEAANFYTAVQAFQVTLGRSIGTQTVSDADAQAFVTNAGIVDQVEANAINNLVIGLKADGLWTKMKAIYPIVGGTASTHKWNLKDPRDLDAAFRLTFATGWTHSSTGMTPLNTYADTKLFASTQLGLNSTHVAVYSRSNTDILAPAISNWTGAANYETSLWLRASNLSYLRINTPTASTQATTDSRGTFIGNRNSSTQQQLMIRGTRYDFSVNSNSLNSTVNYQLGGSSTGAGPTFFDNKQLAFASIGDGLTNTEMTNLTTRIDNFQLALNRNV